VPSLVISATRQFGEICRVKRCWLMRRWCYPVLMASRCLPRLVVVRGLR
jgi:hypothetical protein